MKLTIPRDLLSKSLRRCDLKGAPTGNPALSSVALSARSIPDLPGGLDLRATNGLLGVATMITCTTEREGDVFINTKLLSSAVNMMPPVTLTLESTGENLLVVGGNRRWNRKTLPLSNIKPLPDPPPTAALKFPAEEFLAALARVGFVVANVGAEHTARMGIYLDVTADEANAIVLGDHMVAMHRRALTLGTAGWRGLLPEVVLAHAREIASEAEKGTLEVFSNEHYTWIQNSSTMLVFNPPPGEYFDWRHYMSNFKSTPVCRLPRLAMLESLKALVAASSQDEVSRTWVQVRPDSSVALDYYGHDSAFTFHDDMSVTDLTKNALPAFIINAEYLRDGIDAAGTDPVLNFVDEKHVSLTTEDGYFWASALIYPEPGERPPSGDQPLTPPAEKEAPATEADKPKRSGRKPQGAK